MSKEVTLRLKIGPAVIEVQADRPPQDERRPNHIPFAYTGEEHPTLTIRVRTDPPPPRGNAPLIGECVTQWQLYAQGDRRRLEVLEQTHFEPKQVALINGGFDQADVHLLPLTNRIAKVRQTGWFLAEVMSPLIQWWLTARLAHQAGGMILHGSGVVLRGVGLVFVGPSGAGKTSIARWCRDEAQATVLNDDRILIWHGDGRWQVSGTPWHGELSRVSSVSRPLTALFVLKKAATNRVARLSPIQCLRQLIPEAFLPIWTREGMEGLMETAARLAQEVRTGELEFVNDPSVACFLQELISVSPEATAVRMA